MKQLYTKLIIGILVLCSASLVQAQTLTSINPNSSNISETISVNISGQGNNFGQGTSTTQVILFNGVNMINAEQVQVIGVNNVNAGFTFNYNYQPGSYDVYVSDSAGNFVALPAAFTLNAAITPFTLTNITPSTANSGQVINVTISGQGGSFGQGTSTTNVNLSNGSSTINPDQVSVTSANSLNVQFTLNNNTTIPGSYDVNVHNSIDGSAQIPAGFTVNANPNIPSLTAITPTNTNAGTMIDVTISGQNTHFGQGTATTQVWFNQGSSTLYANSVTVNSVTSLTGHFAISNGAALGVYDANVSENVDGVLNLPASFTVNANPNPPSLVSVTPNSGELGQTIQVTLSGQNTNFTQGTGTIAFSQGSSTLYASVTNIVSDTQIDASLSIPSNAAIGYYDVSIGNSLDGALTLTGGFTVTPAPCGTIYAFVTDVCPTFPGLINMNGGTAPYNISIDGQNYLNNSTDFNFSPTNFGNYRIDSIVDAFGCPAILPFDSLIHYNQFTVSFSASDVCDGTPVTFVNIINSTSAITDIYYTYDDGTNGSSTTHTYSQPLAFNPFISVRNAEGCFADSYIDNWVNVNPVAQIDVVSGNGATCGLSNGAFEVVANGGSGTYTYSVSGPSSYTSASEVNTNLAPGVYNIVATDLADACVSNSTVTVTNISQITNINGTITNSLGDPAVNALVELVSLDDTVGVLPVVAFTTANITGAYSFANLAEGDYIVSADPDTSINHGTIKTYFSNQGVWYLADTLHVTCSSQSSVDIILIDAAVMSGTSNINGTIYDISGTHKTDNVGDPIPGVEVMLFDNGANNVVANTNTNNVGSYFFTGVNAGNYTILVDIPGLGLVSTYSFDVAANQNLANKNFYADSTNHSIDTLGIMVTAIKPIVRVDNDAMVFPNPFSEQTTLKYTLQNNASVKVEVFNILGKKVQTIENTNKVAGTYQTVFNAANLANGIYFINLNINGEQKVFKVIRTE